MPRVTNPNDPPVKQMKDQLESTAKILRSIASTPNGLWFSQDHRVLMEEVQTIDNLIGFLTSMGAFE